MNFPVGQRHLVCSLQYTWLTKGKEDGAFNLNMCSPKFLLAFTGASSQLACLSAALLHRTLFVRKLFGAAFHWKAKPYPRLLYPHYLPKWFLHNSHIKITINLHTKGLIASVPITLYVMPCFQQQKQIEDTLKSKSKKKKPQIWHIFWNYQAENFKMLQLIS